MFWTRTGGLLLRRRAQTMEKNSDIDLLSAEQGDESQHEALLRSAKNREERSFLTALVVYVSVLSVSTEFNSYLLYFAVYAGVFLGIAHFRTRLPAPLSAADADPTHAFAGMRAWDRLVAFTQQPHAFNAERNQDAYNYVLTAVNEIAGSAPAGLVEVVAMETLNATFPVYTSVWSVQGSNILVRVKGIAPDSTRRSVLVSAHYDSQVVSYGATDAGMGLMAAIEILRQISRQGAPRLQNDVVFNFNNLEEFGLFGARIFAMNQDWFPEVKAFINIEGAGHGGREIIFRANNYDVIKAYADSAPHPHANVIGADVFKLGVLQSDTDYTVYAYGYGVPGLDMAFYKGRGFYHTTRDNVNETTPGSMQHVGDNMLAVTRELANADWVTGQNIDYAADKALEPSMFFDVLGLFMYAGPFWTYYVALGVSLGLGVLTSLLHMGYISHSRDTKVTTHMLKGLLTAVWFGVTFLATVVAGAGFAVAMGVIRPFVFYANPVTTVAFFFIMPPAFYIGMNELVLLFARCCGGPATDFSKQTLPAERGRRAQFGLLWFWMLAQIVALVAALVMQIGLLYYTVIWGAAACVAMFIVDVGIMCFRGKGVVVEEIIFFTAHLIFMCPVVINFDITMTLADALGDSYVDGGLPALAFGAAYVMFGGGVCFSPMLVASLRLGHAGKMMTITWLAVIAMFVVTMVVNPSLNPEHPLKVYYGQTFVAATNESYAHVKIPTGVAPFVNDVLPLNTDSNGEQKFTFGPSYCNETFCTFEQVLPPLLPAKAPPMKLLATNTSTTGEVRTVTVRMQVAGSVNVRVEVSYNGYEADKSFAAHITDLDGTPFTAPAPATQPTPADMKALRIIKRFEDPELANELWQFGLEVKHAASASGLTATVYVLYNDWERVPGFSDLMGMLPDWSAPTFQSRQGGLLRVQYDFPL